MSAFVVTVGLLVGSENVTVMVSSLPNIASAPSGSATSIETISGPCFSPKLPSNGGDTAVDARDVVAACRLPLAFTVNLNTSTCGSAEPASIIVMTSVAGSAKKPA